MATLRAFGKRMETLSVRLPVSANNLKKRVAQNVLVAVVRATPLLTGRARYNWNVNFNRPNYSYEYNSFESFARTGAWVTKMSTSGVAILAATRKDSIYISNGLPYIGKLNRGYSAKAPRDYVRTAAIIGARLIRDGRILR